MEQYNCCRCNREYEEPVEYRCACEQARPMKECYRDYTPCAREMYQCTETANDEVGCMPIAMAYVPWQQWGEVFTGECGLYHGTVFPQLVKPWWICCGEK